MDGYKFNEGRLGGYNIGYLFTKEVGEAVAYLHNKHGDIKSHNANGRACFGNYYGKYQCDTDFYVIFLVLEKHIHPVLDALNHSVNNTRFELVDAVPYWLVEQDGVWGAGKYFSESPDDTGDKVLIALIKIDVSDAYTRTARKKVQLLYGVFLRILNLYEGYVRLSDNVGEDPITFILSSSNSGFAKGKGGHCIYEGKLTKDSFLKIDDVSLVNMNLRCDSYITQTPIWKEILNPRETGFFSVQRFDLGLWFDQKKFYDQADAERSMSLRIRHKPEVSHRIVKIPENKVVRYYNA